MIPLEKIAEAKHVVIATDNKTFTDASALYTYILRLHKKVSLYSTAALDYKYSFLPWFDKLRLSKPSSADLVLELSSKSFYNLCKTREIELNRKMATSLYAGFLEDTQGLRKSDLNGTLFAAMSELIALGAEHKLCALKLLQSEPLSLYRLKAKMFEKMCLVHDAKRMLFVFEQEDLDATGTNINDVYSVMQESLNIVHVKEAVLLDNKNEIIKIIEEI